MRAFLLHARSSTTKIGALPLAALGLVILFNRTTFWIGIWPETGAAVTVSAFFMGLFAAGLSAWTAARIDAHGLRERDASANVRPFVLEANRFTAALLWLLVAYLVVVAAALWATSAESFPAGFSFYVGYVMLGLILIILAAGWGWFIGRVLDPVIAAFSATLSWFVFASIFGNATDMAPISGPPWTAIEPDVLVWRLWAVMAFVLAVCALPRRSAPRRARVQRTAAALIILVVVAVIHAIAPVLTPRPPVASPICVQGELQYCLWPEHEKYVPMIWDVDARVAELPLKLELPARMVDYSLSGSLRWVEGTGVEMAGDFPPEFDISEGSRWALARGVASAITSEVFSDCRTSQVIDDPEFRSDKLQAWLEARLAGGGDPDYTTNAPVELQVAWGEGYRVAADLTETEQATWAREIIASRQEQYCPAY